MTEVAMLRSPNQPLGKNNRIVNIYLILILTSILMNGFVAFDHMQTFIFVISLTILVFDLGVFFRIWYSKASYIERSN